MPINKPKFTIVDWRSTPDYMLYIINNLLIPHNLEIEEKNTDNDQFCFRIIKSNGKSTKRRISDKRPN